MINLETKINAKVLFPFSISDLTIISRLVILHVGFLFSVFFCPFSVKGSSVR